jgi:hypothetical protein
MCARSENVMSILFVYDNEKYKNALTFEYARHVQQLVHIFKALFARSMLFLLWNLNIEIDKLL